jgi:hypothetical protein
VQTKLYQRYKRNTGFAIDQHNIADGNFLATLYEDNVKFFQSLSSELGIAAAEKRRSPNVPTFVRFEERSSYSA